MTTYALRLQNGTDTAGRARMADLLGLSTAGNLAARSGVRPGPTAADVAVSAGTMNVTVQPFMAFIDGGVSDSQGGYPFVSDAVVTLTLDNGHSTLTRVDTIAAVVRDNAFDSGGTTSAAVEVVKGTPGAGAPALPLNAVALRNINVPAGASLGTGGLSSGALSTDRRVYLAGLGGVIPVTSQAARDALPQIDGTLVYRADTGALEFRSKGSWEVAAGGWTQAAVGFTAELGTLNDVQGTFYWSRVGDTVHWSLDVHIIDAGSGAGALRLTVPAPAARECFMGAGRDSTTTGFALLAFGATVMSIMRFDNASAIVSGRVLRLGGTYQAA